MPVVQDVAKEIAAAFGSTVFEAILLAQTEVEHLQSKAGIVSCCCS
jgi:hypothetical protein